MVPFNQGGIDDTGRVLVADNSIVPVGMESIQGNCDNKEGKVMTCIK
ncbi:hypothetical protein FOLKNPGA_03271 [Legionella sp. PC1000]|nr:hypothetical protein FOLKNPGA_03271 [Legionella sp. PC1000]